MEGILAFCRKTIVDFALGTKTHDAFRWEKVRDPQGERCYPCRIFHRNHNDSYIAELVIAQQETTKHQRSEMREQEVETPVILVNYILFDVPRDTFYFQDDFYQRDHQQYWSFRHDNHQSNIIIQTEK